MTLVQSGIRIGRSITVAAAVIGVVILAVGGITYWISLDSQRQLTDTSTKGVESMGGQVALVRSLAMLHSNVLALGTETDPISREVRVELVEGFLDDFEHKLKACGGLCQPLIADYNVYLAAWKEVAVGAADNSPANLGKIRTQIEKSFSPTIQKLLDNMDRVSGAATKQAQTVFAESAKRNHQYLNLAAGGGFFIILLFTLVFVIFIRFSIVLPLSDLRQAMIQMKGTRDVRVKSSSWHADELVEIVKTFNEMADNIARNELTIHHQNEVMAQSAKMASLGQMSAGVAHEINNPLAIIQASLQQIQDRTAQNEELKTTIHKQIDRSLRSIQRISKIIQGLRSYARDSSHDPKVEMNLAKFFGETIELCHEQFNKLNVPLRVPEVPQVFMSVRASEIQQVIINLLGNALDAVREYPQDQQWVRVDFAVPSDGKIQLKIVDGGTGIPPEVAKKIMDPFFTTKEIGKGTGLGLSISHGIAEAHGGRLFLDTNAANTTFVLELPYLSQGAKPNAA